MRATLNTLLGCILLVSIHSAALGQQEEPQSGTESKVEGHKAILGDWTISFELGENALDYNLKISEKEGQFVGVFVSPRSGNTYPGKSVTFKDGGVRIVIDRNFDGTDVTMTFEGKPVGGQLSGDLSLAGTDEFDGKWKAVRVKKEPK